MHIRELHLNRTFNIYGQLHQVFEQFFYNIYKIIKDKYLLISIIEIYKEIDGSTNAVALIFDINVTSSISLYYTHIYLIHQIIFKTVFSLSFIVNFGRQARSPFISS